jgi:hypothetical protein
LLHGAGVLICAFEAIHNVLPVSNSELSFDRKVGAELLGSRTEMCKESVTLISPYAVYYQHTMTCSIDQLSLWKR